MATRKKTFSPGYIYFVTYTILNWKHVFTSDKYFDLVYKWFDYMKKEYDNKIHGYVIMPNHLHLLLYVSEFSPVLSKLVQNGKRFQAYDIIDYLTEDRNEELLSLFSKAADKSKDSLHKVFEDRYDSKQMMNADLFKEKLNYIHNNPCTSKWKLAERPEDYRHSSASNYINGSGVYDVELIY
jgi:REP element-mobilizing transposase RayT